VRVPNAAHVQVWHNTFVNTVASFERTERSAVGDHFGWHPRTGPDVDQREGHVFAGNLLVADEWFTKPLLRFEQPAALRSRLTRPQVSKLDGNLYVRRDPAGRLPLIVWSPSPREANLLSFKSPAELARSTVIRDAQPVCESRIRRRHPQPGARPLRSRRGARAVPEPLPADLARLLGWAPG